MNIDITPEDMTNNVQPVRRAGPNGGTQRAVRLYLACGDTVTFWLGPNVIHPHIFHAMQDQAQSLRQEEEKDASTNSQTWG